MPLAALLAGATCIALSPIFVRVSEVGPIASAFWRVALAVPVLWILLWITKEKSLGEKPRLQPLLLAAGLAFAGDLAFWHWSIALTSVANSTLLANLAAIFVTLAAWLLWRQAPSRLFVLGLACALGGVALLIRASVDLSPAALLGDGLGVVTALFYAWYLLTVKAIRERGVAALRLMAVTTSLTAAVLFPLAFFSADPWYPQTEAGWLKLAGLAWVSHVAGQGLIAWSLAHLPAAFSAVGLLLQPVMAALFAWVLLAEPLAPQQMAGGLVVLAGIYLAHRGSKAGQ